MPARDWPTAPTCLYGLCIAADGGRQLSDIDVVTSATDCAECDLARCFAMRQYGLALRADVRVTRAANVLSAVLQVAIDYTGVVEESDANALLTEYWGLPALPAIERAEAQMEAEGREVAAKKLEAMRQTAYRGGSAALIAVGRAGGA